MKDTFIMYADAIEYIADLTDEQLGQLYRAQLQYANGIEPELSDPEVRGIWRVFRHRMDVNAQAYADKCDALRANANKRKQMVANATKSNQIEGDTKTDTDTVLKETLPKGSAKKFAPPAIAEVEAYCLERKNHVDPQAFVDFYQSKGWKVGNQPMKDWKAAVRTWEKERQRGRPRDSIGIRSGTDYDALIAQRAFAVIGG